MERLVVEPRPDWVEIVENQGFNFHTTDAGDPYWDECVAYSFTPSEVDVIKKATEELWDICIKGVEHVIEHNLYYKLRIPGIAIKMIENSWEEEHPSIYGRFDLAWDGTGHPKMLEFNAQTPTSLLEAAAIQAAWVSDVFPWSEQFNKIEKNLLNKWSDLKDEFNGTLYFTSMPNNEDYATVNYLATLAGNEGIAIDYITVPDIGWGNSCFRDLRESPMRNIFALYPWEWLLKEQGNQIWQSWERTKWMEPAWKMILSNKAFMSVLWDLFPGHPNLLATYLNTRNNLKSYVRKPFFSREGNNVSILDANGDYFETKGNYGEEGFVYQEYANLAMTDIGNQDAYAVLGSWYVTDYGASGMGIRESYGPITDNLARFVPHIVTR